jgi:Fe-S cluster biogenesis protein NfuA
MEKSLAAEIQIRGEPQADPDVCRFVADREIFHSGSFVCVSPRNAVGSPLLESIFVIPGITQVWVTGNQVTIQKNSQDEWPLIGKRVGVAIREHFNSGMPFLPPPKLSSADPGLAARVRDVLDTQVNPSVASHGGKIELVEIQGTSALVRMSGGCQGCGSAQATLKQGVERALGAAVPEITEVIDVTDHSAGTRPFYAKTQ